MFFSCFTSHSPELFCCCSLSMFDTTKGERKQKSERDGDKQLSSQKRNIWNTEIQRGKLTNYWESKQGFFSNKKRDLTVKAWHIIYIRWHQKTDERDRGINRRQSFIPSLSILSTASLTRRMTVTMEARQNPEREKKENNVSACGGEHLWVCVNRGDAAHVSYTGVGVTSFQLY